MVLKDVRTKVEKGWTFTKKLLALMSVWGLIFSLVTIGRLSVAFDYDDTLVDPSRAYDRAARAVPQLNTPSYWTVVNNSYEVEAYKFVPLSAAVLLRGLGFRVVILADRGAAGGEALRKEWRRLAPKSFVFTVSPYNKHLHLQDGRFVAFFGDGDEDMLEARKAKVFAVRIKRGRRSTAADPYNPGKLGEWVLPFSDI